MNRAKSVLSELEEEFSGDWQEFFHAIEDMDPSEEVTVEELQAKVSPTWKRSNVVEWMQHLAALELVAFTKGARGRSTRISWRVSPRAIADAGRCRGSEALVAELGEVLPDFQGGTEHHGKSSWSLKEILKVLSERTGVATDDLKIFITIPEAKKLLADSQGISTDEVMIRMG